MKLTPEQTAIIQSEGNIRINAVAGSGKTTTLIEYARTRPQGSRILYIAFNKSVKLEAEKKFKEASQPHVKVETAHSLAFKHIIIRTQNKYTIKKEGSYNTQDIAALLDTNVFVQPAEKFVLANHVNSFLTYFCNSSKPRVQELHYEDTLTDAKARQFAVNFNQEILQQTRQLLAKMDKGEIDITHDFYLKKFQLLKPQLPYDFILFDEGQDASEAMLDVFLNQAATKVIVGDTHQQIYGWRYAVNSLEKVDFPTFHLSTSFRFDNEIAALAAKVLSWKKYFNPGQAPVIINGYGNSDATTAKAVIARTNTALLVKAIELVIEKKEVQKVYFEGRIENYVYADEGASIYDVLNLYLHDFSRIRDKFIATMTSVKELEEYIEKTGDNGLKMILEIVKKYNKKLPGYIKQLKENHLKNNDKETADMIFSTVHRCKGMEYDEVTLTADFITEEKIKKTAEEIAAANAGAAKLSEEINLLYVAVTRTKNILHIPAELLPPSKIKIIDNSKPAASEDLHKAYSYMEARRANKSAYAPWTEEDDVELETTYAQGIAFKELCSHFGRSASAIKNRIEKLELKEKYDF